MKRLYILLAACTPCLAVNLHWNASFYGPPVDGTHVIAEGTYVGDLDIFRVGEDDPYIVLTLDPAFMPQSYAASWLPDPSQSQDWQEYLFSVGVSYSFDPLVLTGIVGRETWLKPFWKVNGAQTQAWVASAFGDPEEYVIPPPDPEPEPDPYPDTDPGDDDDPVIPPNVPETSSWTLLSALGLLGFAARRRKMKLAA